MRRISTIFISLFFVLNINAADNFGTLMHTLDSLISCQDEMVAQKSTQIDNIRKSLSNPALSLRERYMINNSLYQQYVSFQYDSACAYIDRNMLIAKKMGDNYLYTLNLMNKVHTLSLSGLLPEAHDIIMSIDTKLLKGEDMVRLLLSVCLPAYSSRRERQI